MSDNNRKDHSEIDDDYDYARARYYSLAEKGDEAIDLMLDLAKESEHPRAFEVLSNMLKQNAEIADRLMELQKTTQDIKNKDDQKQLPNQYTQNNVYVSSTTDLQKKLQAKMEEQTSNSDNIIDPDNDDEE